MKGFLVKVLGWAFAVALSLSGCATGYLLDNNVLAFSSLTGLPAEPTYRFERLPSQQGPAQAQLEALADGPLHHAGLRRDDANPRHTVQIAGRLERVLSPWASPWYGWGWGWGGGWGMTGHHGGYGWGLGGTYWGMESPWFHREVSVIVRELPSNRVVFESRASNDGPWIDENPVFQAMFTAALEGFPQPPQGNRRVDIPIGR